MDTILKLPAGADRVAVVGPSESNLKMLREALDLRVSARDGRIHLTGSHRAISVARHVLQDLIDASNNDQPLTRKQVQDAIAEASAQVGKTRRGWDTADTSATNGADDDDQEASSSIGDFGSARDEDWGERLNVYVAGKPVRPRTENQAHYLRLIQTHDLVFGLGPAGTGKTYLAVAAAVHMLRAGLVRRVVLARPAVEAGEKLGFLPGDLRDKVNPYLRPLFDALHDMMDYATVRRFMESDVIEVVPLAFMRGRTLNHAVIILDEAQNATAGQMKMFLTRMGQSSRMIVTGDPTQTDLPDGTLSGLTDAAGRLARTKGVAFVGFEKQDVVRHDMVKRIIEAYENVRDKPGAGARERKKHANGAGKPGNSESPSENERWDVREGSMVEEGDKDTAFGIRDSAFEKGSKGNALPATAPLDAMMP